MNKREIDTREFAERVERLCDFLLSMVDTSDEASIEVIRKLKNDAADIQDNQASLSSISLIGLDEHMRGIHRPK